MNGLPLDLQASSATRDQLPPIPPEERDSPRVPLPPKLTVTSSATLDTGLAIPPTPTTPISPSTSSQSETKSKKSNPLNDLIDTEKQYVDQLTGVIRKVAAAWSRTNLPPDDLDIMFRSIEGVYKANRGLYSKLKDIGTNPSSPKALGDLLMRWIDDLKIPYTTYCTRFCTGFDTWEPVQSNPKLAGVLTTFSAALPPPTSPESPIWTLDTLFLLPRARLKYYKKLYGRLLKTTEPGRSDYRLLVGALDTLDFLLGTVESRRTITAGEAGVPQPASVETEDEVVIDTRPKDLPPILPSIGSLSESQPASESDISSFPGGDASGGERSSKETTVTSVSRASTSTLLMPISELERRLVTERTLDIFTMKPKAVTLHMNPSTLTFTRELRFTADVVIRFTPRNTTQEIVHRHGHVFLLSDLFLICERMSPEEQTQYADQGADMWLRYPPLAGKVLRVTSIEGQDTTLQVAIMRKEFLTLEAPTIEIRDNLNKHLKECIEFSGSLPPPAKNPPPPVPPLNPMFASPGHPSSLSSRSSPTSRIGSPLSSDPHASPGPPPVITPPPEGNLLDGMGRMRIDNSGGRPLPLPGLPGPGNLRPSASAQPFVNHAPPFGPGQVPPPARSTSFQSGPPAGAGLGPPHFFGPQHMSAPPHMQGMPPHSHPFPQNMNGPGPFMHAPPGHPGPPQMQNGPFNGPPNGLRPASAGIASSAYPPRPPSEPPLPYPGIRKTPSTRSLTSQFSQHDQPLHAPPLPSIPGGFTSAMSRNGSSPALLAPQPRPLLPSANARATSIVDPSFGGPSPPTSPDPVTTQMNVPVTSVISAQMKCKVFLQQQHAQWKSLGSAKLKLYRQDPTNVKQLVVEADDKHKTVLISTIVLTDGVERVGKTGVAIELSDKGARTGIVYMIQLRNETSAGGLFESLLAGSDRSR